MTLMDETVDTALRKRKDIDAGQSSIFDLFAAEELAEHEPVEAPNGDEWDKKMKLAFEKEMLGIYVSDHPLREIADVVRRGADHSLAEIAELPNGTAGWWAGLLASVDRKPTRRGTMMAVVSLEDLEGSVEAVLFPQVYDKYRDLVEVDAVLRLKARLESDDRGMKLIVSEVEPFDGALFAAPPERIVIETDAGALTNGRAKALKNILGRYPGRDFVEIAVCDEELCRTKTYRLEETVNHRSGGLHAELLELFGPGCVR
jgi:DNA polymerase-3 subunit alpha